MLAIASGIKRRPNLQTLLAACDSENRGTSTEGLSDLSSTPASSPSNTAPIDTNSTSIGAASTIEDSSGSARTSSLRPFHVPVAAGGACFVSLNSSSMAENEAEEANKWARRFIWHHVKFVLCEADADMDSCIAKLAFRKFKDLPCQETYWRKCKNIYVKALQQKRCTTTRAIKEAFMVSFKYKG